MRTLVVYLMILLIGLSCKTEEVFIDRVVEVDGQTQNTQEPLVADNSASSSGTRGGGDANTVEFLLYANNLSNWLIRNSNIFNEETPNKFKEMVEEISSLIEDEKTPSIQFVDEELYDKGGAKKVALFHKEPLHIKINRNMWDELDIQKRYTIVALEIYGLIGVEKRYDNVAITIFYNFNDITELGVSSNGFSSGMMSLTGMAIKNYLNKYQGRPEDYTFWMNDYQESRKKSNQRFERAMYFYEEAPRVYQLEQIATGVFSYRAIDPDDMSISTANNIEDIDLLPRHLDYKLYISLSHTIKNLEIFPSVLEMNEVQKKQLNRIITSLKEVRELITSHKDSNIAEEVTKGFFEEYSNNIVNDIRKQVYEKGCNVFTSFPVIFFEANALERIEQAANETIKDHNEMFKQAVNNYNTFDSQFGSIISEIYDFMRKYDLDDTSFSPPRDEYQVASSLYENINMTEELLSNVYVFNHRFKNFITDPILKGLNNNLLCKK